ncbi:RNA polymerase sigma factor [Gimesia aquarii]|uniref:RNA polymerase sigma factor SigX n=1 Tax=Gimesia aquarii TaxID=2527964 RepID=A0A517X0M7_9PLAN|nr:RNA polymerase sigma factor [Gimesia aquarii]QDU11050.1 RNA polymerase sigma factor SigX [Gimesia aquarii]
MDRPTSYDNLIRPIEDKMLATVWRVLRSTQDAEDTLQDVLTTVWQKWSKIERHPNPRAFILKICANAAIDQLRKQIRLKNRESVSELSHLLPSPHIPPQDEAIGQETLKEIMGAVAQLSENQATAFVMRFVQVEPYENIAMALECEEATARKHVARGKKKLAEILSHLNPNFTEI